MMLLSPWADVILLLPYQRPVFCRCRAGTQVKCWRRGHRGRPGLGARVLWPVCHRIKLFGRYVETSLPQMPRLQGPYWHLDQGQRCQPSPLRASWPGHARCGWHPELVM